MVCAVSSEAEHSFVSNLNIVNRSWVAVAEKRRTLGNVGSPFWTVLPPNVKRSRIRSGIYVPFRGKSVPCLPENWGRQSLDLTVNLPLANSTSKEIIYTGAMFPFLPWQVHGSSIMMVDYEATGQALFWENGFSRASTQ